MGKLAAVALALCLLPGCAPRNRTPEAELAEFWKAMAAGDRDGVLRTMAYYEPGMTSDYIWVPAGIEWLRLDSVTAVYESEDRARLYYQVVFKMRNQTKTTRYGTGTLMVRRNGYWRVGRAIGGPD
ncbi:hypothetical protein EG831_04405 [bacterium]|nr:hypothetical protein [bacterium]